MTQRLFLIDDYLVFVVVVVVVVVAVVVFVVAVAAAEFDVVISADVVVAVFHLVVAVLILFVVPAVASDLEIDDGDSAVSWYFLEIFDDYFGDLGDVVESVVCRLYLRILVQLEVFLLRLVIASKVTV